VGLLALEPDGQEIRLKRISALTCHVCIGALCLLKSGRLTKNQFDYSPRLDMGR